MEEQRTSRLDLIFNVIKSNREAINEVVCKAKHELVKEISKYIKEGQELVTTAGIPFSMFGEYYLIFEIYLQGEEIALEMNHANDVQFDQMTYKIGFESLCLADKVQLFDKLDYRFGEMKVKDRDI